MKGHLATAFVCLASVSALALSALAQEARPGAAATTIAPAASAPAAAPAVTPPPTVPFNPDYAALVEGKPFDTRQNENIHDKPLYPEQTRAPYHKTAPYKLTEITGKLYAPWAVAFLPDGKYLVTEKLPGALRVVSPDGTTVRLDSKTVSDQADRDDDGLITDNKLRLAPLPNLSVGAVVDRTAVTRGKSLFDLGASVVEALSNRAPEKKRVVEIDVPALRGKRGETAFELTPRELAVLALLYRERGHAVSRDRILNEVWGIEYYGTTRTLDQVIVKIRQKIETEPAEPRHLLTVHGLGYRLDP